MPEVRESMKVEDLYLEDDLFSCSWPPRSERLEASIRRVGLLRPVDVVDRDGRWVVAAGLRRARAARALGLRKIRVRRLDPPRPQDAALFFMNLEDNLGERSLNYFERARALKRMEQDLNIPDPTAKTLYRGLLDIPEGDEAERLFLAADALPDAVKNLLHGRDWGERFARIFSELPADEAGGLAQTAEALRLTASQVRETAEWGREAAAKEETSFLELLTRLREASGNPDQESGPKSGARPRDVFMIRLRGLRFPESSRVRDALDETLLRVNGNPGLHVAPPPHLESDRFAATLNFRDGDELALRVRSLLDFAGSGELARAVELLEGSAETFG